MRKYTACLYVMALVLFASCEEVGPTINFQDVQAVEGDTTYVLSTVPVSQPRNVLIEEFTGVSCPNCPSGHDIVRSLHTTTNHRIVAVGLYKENLPLTAPRAGTDDDFRLPIANLVDEAIYANGAGSLPIAGIDRTPYDNTMLSDRFKWVAAVNARLTVPTVVNLEALPTYDEATHTLNVKITATFTADVANTIFLTAGIVQDSIIDAQEKGLQEIEDYQHDHVMRGLITPNGVNGLELTKPGAGGYEKGRVFVRYLSYPIPADMQGRLKPEHCHIYLFAHYNGTPTKESLQAIEVEME